MRACLALAIIVVGLPAGGGEPVRGRPALPPSRAGNQTDSPARLEIRLSDSRWQALPQEVRRVTVAPDGRIWYQRAPHVPWGNVTLVALKQELAREFAEPAPQIRHCELALIEPGGRAWFWVSQHVTLLGYDGKGWLDRVIPSANNYPAGRCPTRGILHDGRSNRFAGGAAWFLGRRGVHRFDGKDWSYQSLADAADQDGPLAPMARGLASLAVSPDGTTAAACVPGGPIWLWRDGRWSRFVPPQLIRPGGAPDDGSGDNARQVVGLALPDARNLWCLQGDGCLVPCSLEAPQRGKTAPDKRVSDLIDALADDAFATRENASRQLAALGAAVRPQLEQALAISTDAEQRARLKRLLGRFRPEIADRRGCKLGAVEVADVAALYQDERGRLMVAAAAIAEAQAAGGTGGPGATGPGLAILSPDGSSTTVVGEPCFNDPQRMRFGVPPVLGPPRDRVWLSLGEPAASVRLLDWERKAYVDALPDSGWGAVHAVTEDGRVFASRQSNDWGNEPLMVYTPARK
jgi:hypothetical protein